MSNKSLAKSAGTISTATLLSRILGFIRDVIIANFFGTARYAQAFVVAFRIPNMLRDLIGEGATNAAFVPVFSECIATRTKEEFWELANVVLNLLLAILMVIAILGEIFSPFIVKVIAPGFMEDPEKLYITIKLTRLMFPYVLLIGLSAYGMGILHSFKSFLTPALGPSLLNISLIASALFLCPRIKESVLGLAFGVLAGGLLQLCIQIPALLKKGWLLRLKRKFYHPKAAKIGRLLLPRFFGSCIYQVNLFVATILASLAFIVGEGGVAALYYANRIIQFPLAVFGIAVAQAALPTMSGQAATDNIAQLKRTFSFALRSISFVTIPASVGLIILSRPIIKVLFQRGQFNAYSTSITSYALLFYSFGLFAYAGIKILVASFYSLQDTLTPVKIALFSLGINIALSLILMGPLRVGGIALASSISATINLILLFFLLSRRLGGLQSYGLRDSLLKILFASILMGITGFLFKNFLFFNLPEALKLFLNIFLSLLSFLLFCFILKVKELRELLRWISKRS